MTIRELITRLETYPPNAHVAMAVDWSEPGIDDSYLAIPGDPTIALDVTGWAKGVPVVATDFIPVDDALIHE